MTSHSPISEISGVIPPSIFGLKDCPSVGTRPLQWWAQIIKSSCQESNRLPSPPPPPKWPRRTRRAIIRIVLYCTADNIAIITAHGYKLIVMFHSIFAHSSGTVTRRIGPQYQPQTSRTDLPNRKNEPVAIQSLLLLFRSENVGSGKLNLQHSNVTERLTTTSSSASPSPSQI